MYNSICFCINGLNALISFQFKVETDKDKYMLDGQTAIGKIKITASSNSFVMAQMVDHAVLVLNDRTTLTPERVRNYYICAFIWGMPG